MVLAGSSKGYPMDEIKHEYAYKFKKTYIKPNETLTDNKGEGHSFNR